MRAIEFPEVNRVYAKDQPQYNSLPVYAKPNDPNGLIISKWTFTPEEYKRIFETGTFYLSIMTFNNPLSPLLLAVDYPEQEHPAEYESPVFGDIVEKLISMRKKDQLTGRTLERDIQLQYGTQLSYIASVLSNGNLDTLTDDYLREICPPNWNIGEFIKDCRKPYEERLLLSACFLVSELDRLRAIEGGANYGQRK